MVLNPRLGSFNKVYNFVLCLELGLKGILNFYLKFTKQKNILECLFFYIEIVEICCTTQYIYILQVGIADKSNLKREFEDCHGT